MLKTNYFDSQINSS